MKLSKSVLKQIAIELRSKNEQQLNDLLNIYEDKINNLSDEYYIIPLNQKLELVKSELNYRKSLNLNQI